MPRQVDPAVEQLVRAALKQGVSQGSVRRLHGVGASFVGRIYNELRDAGDLPTPNGAVYGTDRTALNSAPIPIRMTPAGATVSLQRYTRDRQRAVVDAILTRVEELLPWQNDPKAVKELSVTTGICIDKLWKLDEADGTGSGAAEDDGELGVDDADAIRGRIIRLTADLRAGGVPSESQSGAS